MGSRQRNQESTSMATMQAARVHQWGDSDNVHIDDVPLPELQADQILVRVRASSINPIDWKAQLGYMKDYFPLPLILGWEAAGEVAALGADAGDSGLKVGDPVYMTTHGGFAQYVAVSKEKVALKPH